VNAEEIEFTLRQAMRTAAFWIMILATLRAAACSIDHRSFRPIMVWKGASEKRAAALLATMALMSLPSHLLIAGSPIMSARRG
jgi:hypothetical protein